MKKWFLFLLIAFLSYQSNAQILISLLFGDKLNSERVEFGLEGGMNFSMIESFESKKYLPTLNLGLYFNYKLKKSWYLYTGVLVKSNLGTNKLSSSDLELLKTTVYNAEGTYSQKIQYFIVPLLAKYQFKNNIYLEAGPQAGLRTKSWVEFRCDDDNTSAKIKNFNSDNIHRVDFGLVGGFGHKFKLKSGQQGMSIGVKYYYGLLDVYKDITGSNNSSFFLKVNIPVGAGKKRNPQKTRK